MTDTKTRPTTRPCFSDVLFVALCALVIQCTGCSLNQGVHRVKWGHDGTYLFCIERVIENLWSPDPHPHPSLYSTNLAFGNRTRIARDNSGGYLESFVPSPKLPRVLYYTYLVESLPRASRYEMSVVDARTGQKLVSKVMQAPWPMEYGWHPSGNAIFFTDDKGIEIWFLDEKEARLLLQHQSKVNNALRSSEKFYAASWSDEGDLLAYKTGHGRYHGNTLYLFNTSEKAGTPIGSITDGLYGPAFFTTDGRFLVYSTYLHSDDSITVRQLDLKTRKEIVLWRNADQQFVYDLRRTRDSRTFILEYGSGTSLGPRKVLIIENASQKGEIPCRFWDYHEGTDAVVCVREPKASAEIIAMPELRDRKKRK